MNIKAIFLFLFFISVTICETYSQNLNDFRTISDGNWATPGIWERYDGTMWVTSTVAPGLSANANDVTIMKDHVVTLDTSTTNPYSLNSLTIGDRNGTATDISRLVIDGDFTINTSQFTIAYDGLLFWAGNHTLFLPDGAVFSIERENPYQSNTIGEDYGVFINTTGCNVNKKLQIGSVIYSNCNGGGPNPKPLEFEEVNNSGGNLSVFPNSNTPVCNNSSVLLTANPGGTELSNPNYNWTVISSPVAYSFSSNVETPTDTPTAIGTYVYQVTLTNDNGMGDTVIGTTTVEINNCNKTIITNRRITYRVKK